MAFQLSPSVKVTEEDFSLSIQNSAVDIAADVGDFEWGPCFERTFLSETTSFIKKFGSKTDSNYEHWFSAKNLFDYTQSVYIVRVANDTFMNAGLKVLNNDQADPGTAAFSALQYNGDEKNTLTNTELNFQTTEKLALLAKYPGLPGNNIDVAMASYEDFSTSAAPAPVDHNLYLLTVNPPEQLPIGDYTDSIYSLTPGATIAFLHNDVPAGYDNATLVDVALHNEGNSRPQILVWLPSAAYFSIIDGDGSTTFYNPDDPEITYEVYSKSLASASIDYYAVTDRYQTDGYPDHPVFSSTGNVSAENFPSDASNDGLIFDFYNSGAGGSAILQFGSDIYEGKNIFIGKEKEYSSGGTLAVGDNIAGSSSGTSTPPDVPYTTSGIPYATITELIAATETRSMVVAGSTGSGSVDASPVYETINSVDYLFEDELEYPLEEGQTAIFVWFNDVLKEKHIVSFDSDARDYRNKSIYIEEKINRESAYLWAYENNASTLPPYQIKRTPLAGGVQGTITNSDVIAGYNLFENPKEVDVQFIIDGANCNETIHQHIIDNIVEERKDCVAYFCFPRDLIVGIPDDSTIIDNCTTYVNTTLNRANTSYAAIYANWKYQYDAISDKYYWIPCSADAAGIWAAKATDENIWIAGAGYDDDVAVKNVSKFAWNPKESYIAKLYNNNINCLIIDSSQALIIGQKTLYNRASYFSRLDIRWLFITLEKGIANSAKYFIMKKNTPELRRKYLNMVEPFIKKIQGQDGIDDYRLICNETNNTDEVLNEYGFVADHYIKPTMTAEFIQLNFYNVGQTLNFDEIIS